MFHNFFRIARRRLIKDRQFTILNLVGLSTGLASAILIFLWVNDEMSIDKFNEKDSRIYQAMYNIQTADNILTIDQTPSPLAAALVAEMPEVETAVSINPFMNGFVGPGVVSFENKHIGAQGIFAGKDYFNVFSFRLIHGHKDTVLADKNGVLLSKSLAKKMFGTTEGIMGKTLEWDHRVKLEGPFYISGIFENPPANSTSQFDIIFNYENLYKGDRYAKDWTGTYAKTYMVLKKGTDQKAFEKKIRDFTKTKDPRNNICSIFIQQFSKKYLYGQYENGVVAGGRIQYVKLFSIIALFILIIACINFMNLSTAQATGKMKEIGVKKTIGASRRSLVLQFLGESIFMALLSLIVAMLLVVLLLPGFNEITGKQIQINYEAGFILPIIGTALFTGLVSGLYPAFYLSAFKPVTVLKGNPKTSIGELWIRKGLVVTQFSLSIIFIVGFLIINKQIDFIRTKNLGYNRDNIVSFQREGEITGDPEVFLSMLKNIPGVINAAGMAGSILDDTDNQSGFSWRGQKSDEEYSFKSPRICYDVVETLGLKLLAGRTFSREFKDDDSKIILNESALKKMGLKDPIGKTIEKGDSQAQIIGVVKDFQYGSMHHTIEPLIFRFRNARVSNRILVKIAAGNEASSIKKIESLYKQLHPKYSFTFTFLDEAYQQLYSSEQRAGKLSKYFAGLAIIISCLGLFGLAAFAAQRRQKEIGIRKIVGASVSNIVLMLSGNLLKLVSVSIVIALPIASWAMNKWLENFAYKTTISVWIFVVAGAIALGIALLTVSFQSVRAAVTNPVRSLRNE
ncbi:ABC transporter permease [Flavitalea sp.]|nr:ABC transporter permease [Flavitalea sp.]